MPLTVKTLTVMTRVSLCSCFYSECFAIVTQCEARSRRGHQLLSSGIHRPLSAWRNVYCNKSECDSTLMLGRQTCHGCRPARYPTPFRQAALLHTLSEDDMHLECGAWCFRCPSSFHHRRPVRRVVAEDIYIADSNACRLPRCSKPSI